HRAMGRDRTLPTEEVPDEVDQSDNPEDFALLNDGSNRVRSLLDTLSDKARNIIILRVVVGLSAEETAEDVNAAPGAVRVAQHRALAERRKVGGANTENRRRPKQRSDVRQKTIVTQMIKLNA